MHEGFHAPFPLLSSRCTVSKSAGDEWSNSNDEYLSPVLSRPTLKARALIARMRREAATTSAPALAIQSAARRYLARRRFNRLVKDKQIEWEWGTMATEMGRFCAERARLRYDNRFPCLRG